jgi:hypothetical protein
MEKRDANYDMPSRYDKLSTAQVLEQWSSG